MNAEKVTKYIDKLVSKNSGKIFTSRSDVLKMIIHYKTNTLDSSDAKLIYDIKE